MKDKAILVMDMPEGCDNCPFNFVTDYSEYCGFNDDRYPKDVYDFVTTRTKPSWCPLKPMPEKYDLNKPHTIDWTGEYEEGYNACIDEILGGDEEC